MVEDPTLSSKLALPDEGGEIARLELLAAQVRQTAIEYISRSGSGHPGGSLSVADILTAIYFGRLHDAATDIWHPVMRYDPAEPLWEDRDRFILGKGHAAPCLYAVLCEAGFIDRSAFSIVRKIDCPLEGHPVMYREWQEKGKVVSSGVRGVDFPAGSLGHGLSAAAGMALHASVYGHNYVTYVVLGDGDMQEGMTWEAAMTIPNKKLGSVCALLDYNGLQVDGSTESINSIEPLARKLEAFNWEVLSIDGHNLRHIISALAQFRSPARAGARPLFVIARTTKGKGVREIEGDYRFHAVPLTGSSYERAMSELAQEVESIRMRHRAPAGIPVSSKPRHTRRPTDLAQDLGEVVRRNPLGNYSGPTATRIGYGNALARLGEFRRIFVLNADLAGACGTSRYLELYGEDAPDPKDRRAVNVGVQECNMMTMGAAIAACGKIPVVNSFGIFSTGRAWEMVRQDISYPSLNVKIVGSHTGLALGEYGVTHQAVEDVSLMRTLPNIAVIEPSDAVQADLLFEQILAHEGPVYLRLGRNPTPLIYVEGNPWGVARICDFRIGKGYTLHDGVDVALVASGPMVIQALDVARLVEESVRVIDMPTIRPLDTAIVEAAGRETHLVCSLQDHLDSGGLGDEVARALLRVGVPVRFESIALSGYGRSGSAEDLYDRYGLSARSIIRRLGLHSKPDAKGRVPSAG